MIFGIIKKNFLDTINVSLSEGICPKSWETSNVMPIPN